MASSTLDPNIHGKLAEAISKFYDDPLGFVLFAYPWGEEYLPDGSRNPLRFKKIERWQRVLLKKIGEHIKNNGLRDMVGLERVVGRFARVSGHGVGKSAIVAWLIHFFMATRPDTRIVVTANTQTQLETRTWPELAKWHRLFICKEWFTWTSTSYYFAPYPDDQRKNYMASAYTVAEDNIDAFQGLHNEGKTVVVIFDEASGIHSKLYEATLGAFTDGEGFFLLFGNPSTPEGEFYNICTDKKYHKLWDVGVVDSREVSFTNKAEIQEIIDLYGLEHDTVKVRYLGIFPDQSYNGFISIGAVEAAMTRELVPDSGESKIMGVDVARYGPDKTVLTLRQGRDARSTAQIKLGGLSAVKCADAICKYADMWDVDGIVIESTGLGAGVVDICRDRGLRIFEVHTGAPADNPAEYANKRCELWGRMRDWILMAGCLPNDPVLAKYLTSIQYSFTQKTQAIQLESKEDMKERLKLSSPDEADSLALTFAFKFPRKDRSYSRARHANAAVTDDSLLHERA